MDGHDLVDVVVSVSFGILEIRVEGVGYKGGDAVADIAVRQNVAY